MTVQPAAITLCLKLFRPDLGVFPLKLIRLFLFLHKRSDLLICPYSLHPFLY